jgi:hypothetical protein
MSWGKIYDVTWWGNPKQTGWGEIYYPYTDPTPTPFFEVLAEDGAFLQTEQNEYIIIE